MRPIQDDDLSLEQWIDYVFDHPVTDPAWHWALDAPYWRGDAARVLTLVAETFERSAELLARFTDSQLNQGFWFLVSNSCSDYMLALTDGEVPWPDRLRALRSFVPLFERVMTARCSPHLSHLDEPGANPLNSACYMWWDILPIAGRPGVPERAALDAEALSVLQRILALPHDACRESALHGLGHWRIYYSQATEIIDGFLRSTPDLRRELVAYAEQAKTGCIQ